MRKPLSTEVGRIIISKTSLLINTSYIASDQIKIFIINIIIGPFKMETNISCIFQYATTKCSNSFETFHGVPA